MLDRKLASATEAAKRMVGPQPELGRTRMSPILRRCQSPWGPMSTDRVD